MYHDTERFVDLDFEQAVRVTAYHLWEQDGRPDGREKEYWFRALQQELAAHEGTPVALHQNPDEPGAEGIASARADEDTYD